MNPLKYFYNKLMKTCVVLIIALLYHLHLLQEYPYSDIGRNWPFEVQNNINFSPTIKISPFESIPFSSELIFHIAIIFSRTFYMVLYFNSISF